MNPLSAVAIKTLGVGGAAALLGLGLTGGLAQAASPTPNPTPTAAAKAAAPEHSAARRAVFRAVFESEADVLGLTTKALRADLRAGQKIQDLAKDKGMTKEQFETKVVAALRPRLETLVEQKVILQARADKVIDRISKGHVPFWEGLHKRA